MFRLYNRFEITYFDVTVVPIGILVVFSVPFLHLCAASKGVAHCCKSRKVWYLRLEMEGNGTTEKECPSTVLSLQWDHDGNKIDLPAHAFRWEHRPKMS